MKLFSVILIMLLMLSNIAFALPTFLIAHDDGPSSDVLKLTSVATLLVSEGYDSQVKLNSEVDKEDIVDRVTVFMYYGNTLIIRPLGQVYLVDLISSHLLDNYGIVAEIQDPEEIRYDDLIKEFEDCTDCPDPEYSITEAFISFEDTEEGREALIIRNIDDSKADEILRKGGKLNVGEDDRSKLPEEIVASDLFNKNIIILGGPCANTYWLMYSSETCDSWPLSEGQGIIKSVWHEERNVILIAGTTEADTLALSIMIGSGRVADQVSGQTEIVLTV